MSEFGQVYGRVMYFWPAAAVVILVGLLFLNWLFDPRREFHVTMVNAGQNEISDAKSWLDDWYIDVGWLRYGVLKTDSNLEYAPPKLARVSWKKGELRFDRSVEILGTICPARTADIPHFHQQEPLFKALFPRKAPQNLPSVLINA